MHDGMARVRGVRVDVGALLGIEPCCSAAARRRCRCCCAQYEITLTEAEIPRVTGLAREAARYAPQLVEDGALVNPFEPLGGGLYALDAGEDECCVFGYDNGAGETLCALHTAALALGLDPYVHKPQVCTLWPLALSEGRPRVLGVQEDAFRFPCNRRPRKPRSTLHRGVREIVGAVFGARFLAALESHMENGGGR